MKRGGAVEGNRRGGEKEEAMNGEIDEEDKAGGEKKENKRAKE